MRPRRFLAAVLILAAAAACARRPPLEPEVLARIGPDQLVRAADFEAYFRRNVGEEEEVLSSVVLSELFDQFVDEELLVRLAVDRGLVPPGASQRRAVNALLARMPERTWTDPEVAAYYQGHRSEFERPERVHLRQILVEDRGAAEAALRALEAGEDFEAVARRLSLDPTSDRGGDQGQLAREDLPPAFADLVFGLQPGGISGIVSAEYGFHIFQVVARLPAEVEPLAEAADEIRERLRQQWADQALGDLISEARKRYNVEVYPHHFDFNYQGDYRAKDQAGS